MCTIISNETTLTCRYANSIKQYLKSTVLNNCTGLTASYKVVSQIMMLYADDKLIVKPGNSKIVSTS